VERDVVPPCAPHCVACDARTIARLADEPETIGREALRDFRRGGGGDASAFMARLR
jgi:hypothetical protein